MGAIGKHMMPHVVIVLALAAAMSLVGGVSSAAEYQDLIDVPALKMDAAATSLLLDITSTGERLVAVGERGHIIVSDDQGQTWSQASVDTRAHLNAVVFTDTTKGWVVGEDAVILHSTDGGSTWQRQFDARDADFRGPLLDLWFKNANEGLAVGVYNKIYRTTDGGKNWQDWYDHVDNIDEWHLFAIAAATDRVIYISSEKGLVFRSLDGGESFAPLQTPHDGSFQGILAQRDQNGQDRIVLCGVGGVVYASTDSGQTWQRLDTGTQVGLYGGAWLTDGSAVIVGHDGMVMRIDPSLTRVDRFPQENGLPLNAVTASEAESLFMVGFGGVQKIAMPEATN